MKTLFSICLLLSIFSFTSNASERIIKDIEYAVVDKQSLALDLYPPKGVKNPPLVLWIHGGGWKRGSKDKCNICWLTKYGFAVASISSIKRSFLPRFTTVKLLFVG